MLTIVYIHKYVMMWTQEQNAPFVEDEPLLGRLVGRAALVTAKKVKTGTSCTRRADAGPTQTEHRFEAVFGVMSTCRNGTRPFSSQTVTDQRLSADKEY